MSASQTGSRAPGWISTLGLIVAVVGLAVDLSSRRVTAQASGQSGRPLRLFVFDCGTNSQRDPLGNGLTKEQANLELRGLGAAVLVDHPTPCYLIVHAKGTLLFETGKNDAVYNRYGGGPRGDYVTRSLKSQLAEIGYKAEDITYLAMSHNHSDHSGNSNDYASSTWLVQKAERDFMFGGKPLSNNDDFSRLKDSKTVIIENTDYDVFSDGKVMLIFTGGHTPGHQVLLIRLANTGPVLLTGDLYNDVAVRRFNAMNAADRKGGMAQAREILERVAARTGAEVWIQHDLSTFKELRKSPLYYE
jgi:N-acyl homoserine lactone hydrolase